jgi:outer membrane protein
MKTFFGAAFVILVLVIGTGSAAAQVKIGFVDTDVILQQMKEYKQVEQRLRGLQASYEDTLRVMQTDFQTKLESYQKQRELMNPATRAQEEANLGALRDQIVGYQQANLGQQGTLFQLQAQLVQPIREKVRSAVERVAKDQKLSAVMETGLMIYYDKKMDITYKVMESLNSGDK